ncbi:MAG: hypothetical protein MUC36_01035 [Planctomycetes bacterium]|nr:hypothetical protein [Planctomycetota bacterium]
MNKARILIENWLHLDFFGDARRLGSNQSSSLTTTIFAQSFLAFLFAAMLYPEVPPVPFAAANLCLSSLLVAIGSLGDESRPGRRAADELLLATSPVPRLAVAMARAGHAAFYVVLVTIGMALPPGILLACWLDEPMQALAYVGCACACSGLATGALGVVARATERWLGTDRTALLLGTSKALLLGGGLVLFALGLQRLQATADALPIGRFGAELLPPYQAALWLRAPATESWRLVPFALGGAVLLLLAMLFGGRTAVRARRNRHSGALGWLLRRLCGSGPRLGIAEFTATNMWRSAGFRARVLPLLGVPAGMAFLSLRGSGDGEGFVLLCLLLQLPAIYLPFLIAFLPRADQPGTSWVFDQAPTLDPALVRDATWRALVSHVLLPVQALTLVLLLLSSRVPLAATSAALFAAGLAVLAARLMVRALPGVPFTRNQEGDQGADLGSAFAAALILGGLGTGFGIALPTNLRWPVAIAACAAAALALRSRPQASAEPLHGRQERTPERAQIEAAGAPEAAVAAEDRRATPAAAPTSLGRELRAIGVLYVAVCVLPLLVGTMFAR